MDKRDELIKKYEARIKKRNIILKIMYFGFQALTVLTAIASLVLFFTQDTGLETTLNQIFMCVMCLLFFNIPIFIERKLKVFIPGYILGVFYVFLFAHFVLGEVYRIYDHSLLFDKILHTTSGAIYALLGFSLVFMLNRTMPDKIKLTPFSIALFAFCFAMTTEYVWELVEYCIDRIAGSNMQRWVDGITEYLADGSVVSSVPYGSGLKDSMVDMAVNIAGGLAVCIYEYIGMKLRPATLGTKLILTDTQIRELAREKADAELAASDENPDATDENFDENFESNNKIAENIAGKSENSVKNSDAEENSENIAGNSETVENSENSAANSEENSEENSKQNSEGNGDKIEKAEESSDKKENVSETAAGDETIRSEAAAALDEKSSGEEPPKS